MVNVCRYDAGFSIMLQRCQKNILEKTASALTCIMQCHAKTLKRCKSIKALFWSQRDCTEANSYRLINKQKKMLTASDSSKQLNKGKSGTMIFHDRHKHFTSAGFRKESSF